LRLKLRNGQITEAEHLIARNLSERSLANLQTPRPGLLAAVPQGEGSAGPDAEDRSVILRGARHRQWQPRRIEIADVETGLMFGRSQFRHPMQGEVLKIVGVPGLETLNMNYNRFDLPAAHIFKVRGGKIHEIEAMDFTMPYNSKTGWEELAGK
jgi:hypothetical protein